jgi:osmotically-inducible protein OsmY
MVKLLKRLSTLLAAATLMTLLGCASTSQEGTGGYVNDALITSKVKAAIFKEPSLKSAEIKVETSKGVVQLSGLVSSRLNITRAISVTRSVSGVRAVNDEMRVKPHDPKT